MKYFIVLLALTTLVFCGCSPKAVKPVESVTPTVTDSTLSSDKSGDTGKGGISEEELAKAERERLAREREEAARNAAARNIMFEYDSYLVQSSEMHKIEAITGSMKNNLSQHVTAEGHCDERGTIEYNLALGQKRAEAVKDLIIKSGIDGSRIKTVSFGKEAPVDPGHGEEAWAKNRRVYIKIE